MKLACVYVDQGPWDVECIERECTYNTIEEQLLELEHGVQTYVDPLVPITSLQNSVN